MFISVSLSFSFSVERMNDLFFHITLYLSQFHDHYSSLVFVCVCVCVQVMTPESMNKLADQYTSSSSGLVDYMCCFREFLTDLSSANFLPKMQTSSSFDGDLEGGGGGGSSGGGPMQLPTGHLCRSSGPLHPWDFQYKRERHAMPYWNTAATAKDVLLADAFTPLPVPAANIKSAANLNDSERETLLAQYPAKVLSICSKCYVAFLPQWKSLRNELQRAQIASQRGSIIVDKFQAILEHYGSQLSKSEWGTLVRSFRGMGLQDVVKFDDFLRVCMIVKASCA